MKKSKMNTKNFMVFFVAIVMALFVVTTVSAIANTTTSEVTVEGITYEYTTESNLAVTAGETITVKVYFTADENASEVVIKAELGDTVVKTSKFDVEDEKTYRKVLNIKVPYDFDDDELSTELDFEIEISADDCDDETLVDDELTVQRPSYNVDFKSVNVAKNVESGETFPVDILVKNNGYNDLDDLYVTAKIPALDVEESFYFGDLVDAEEDSTSDDDDDTDTMNKRIYLTVPYDTATGTYALEVEVSNEEAVISKTVDIEVTNSFPDKVIKSGNDLILVNPTDNIVGYRIVVESPASVSEDVVFVQAGSSETITVTPNAEGEYSFDVSVFSMDGKLVSTVTFSGSEAVSPIQSPIVILTVVLAIVFLVLLVVLIVLITKKPEKADEFGESYY